MDVGSCWINHMHGIVAFEEEIIRLIEMTLIGGGAMAEMRRMVEFHTDSTQHLPLRLCGFARVSLYIPPIPWKIALNPLKYHEDHPHHAYKGRGDGCLH